MKYLTKFNSHTDYESFIEENKRILPNVSICDSPHHAHFSKKENVNEIVKKDYKELYKESPSLYYWESHVVLNKKLEEVTDISEIVPVSIENIFEINEVVIRKTTNIITGKKSEIREPETWWESHVIFPEDFKLSFQDAVNAYWNSDLKTTGNKITLRRPFNPLFTEAYYIFGQQDSPNYVFVNAVTGKVSTDGQ